MKKLIEIIVCMLLIGTCFIVTLGTVSADQEGNFTYTVSNGQATLTKYTGAGGAVTIPSTLGGYPTVRIGDSVFASEDIRYSLTSVVIPDSVTSIGNATFASCQVLTSLTIPNSVTTIGYSAFSSCTKLTSITLPRSLTTIGDQTFYWCFALTSVNIPNSVTSIGSQAFGSCISLTSVIIPDSVTTIYKYAFQSCTGLTTATIGNGVTVIGVGDYGGGFVFTGCTSLTTVTIGNSVTTIARATFDGCSSLTSITFLGLVAPTTVGQDWIRNTPAEIRGHAYATSDFLVPGSVWNGLTMGTVIGSENKPPVAGFTWTPSSPTANQTITFDASASSDPDGSITTYEWDWNNDGTYEDSHATPTATHSWAQAGNYPITIQVTDNDGATITKTMTVAVAATPNNPTSPKTPGFELVFVLGAIAVALLLMKKKRNV